MLSTCDTYVKKKHAFPVSRRAFFRLIMPWAGLITLTAYTTTKSRWLDRIIDAAERGRA